jgi:hypothetical protein
VRSLFFALQPFASDESRGQIKDVMNGFAGRTRRGPKKKAQERYQKGGVSHVLATGLAEISRFLLSCSEL